MTEISSKNQWLEIGNKDELINQIKKENFKLVLIDNKEVLITYEEDKFSAIYGRCNHMGGPLARGKIKGKCIECPWHYWSFNLQDGVGINETSMPLATKAGALQTYQVKIVNEIVYISSSAANERIRPEYNTKLEVASLSRKPEKQPGKTKILGISTTAMDKNHPRFSTSEFLLKNSLEKASAELDIEYKIISLSELNFRNCEGFYSKSERACTWPCSISKMDPADEMKHIYEAMVHWADIVIVATPIRWGSASSLYYKMVERLNSIQNYITTSNQVLINNKIAGFIITGGQDNVQAVAGQMLNFFGELGFIAPQFPYVGHSLGWSSENMEKNMDYVLKNQYLLDQSFDLIKRTVDLSEKLFSSKI